MHKKSLPAILLVIFSLFVVAGTGKIYPEKTKLSSVENANLKQGADAYKNGDWTTAIFFLRKVVSDSSSPAATDENYFMLIKSEIYAGEYRQAQNDCEQFLNKFKTSPYGEHVQYQNGRLLHLLSRNEDAVLSLSDFCHEHSDSELYPLALFWIAESFYDEYNFESARGLYERVVSDFPGCEKAPQAQYKLDLIERRAREEKLLYLLKVIGEENLSTREEYERQLRIYALEDEKGIKKSLIEAEARIQELEELLEGGEQPAITEPEPEEENKNGTESQAEAKKEEPKTSESKQEEPKSSGVSKPASPNTQIIQSVTEPSLRVKQNENGSGTSAAKTQTDSNSKDNELRALKRKARQLKYILDDQEKKSTDSQSNGGK